MRDDFDRKIDLFASQPFDPRLDTHKLKGSLSKYYAFGLCKGFRVLFRFGESGEINLLDIGPHNKYRNWDKYF